jgi:hypothetical protein
LSRTFRVAARVLAFLRVERVDIHTRGDLYLTRWFLLGTSTSEGRRIYLHFFHRSDSDRALHDHPWPFTSLVLWPGYFEWTDEPTRRICSIAIQRPTWYGPLSILRRRATWRHRVQLLPGRNCWTLVWVGKKERSWGFHCERRWVPWREFIERNDAGQDGCGE